MYTKRCTRFEDFIVGLQSITCFGEMYCLHHQNGLLFDPGDAGNIFLQNQTTWYYIPEGSTLKYRIFVENFLEDTT
jgi:hypothetical protein